MSKLLVWKKWKNPISEAIQTRMDEMDEGGDEDMIYENPDQMLASPIIYDPDSMLHLWTAHTTFIVTKKAKRVVKGVPGVAYYRSITPYMFNIGVGELFCQQKVKQEIVNRLIVDEFEDDLISDYELTIGDHMEQIVALRKTIEDEFWAIYVLPNGEAKVVCSKFADEDFFQKIKEFKEVQNSVGGHLISYMDEE